MITQLWPTPVGVFEIGDADLTLAVAEAISQNPTMVVADNIWDNPAPAIGVLAGLMVDKGTEVMRLHQREIKIRHGRGWAYKTKPGEFLKPHAHPFNILVGVYYVKAEPGSGDLLLHDPMSGSLWSGGIDNSHTCYPFHRIVPRPGTAVFFPGHVMHTVEPNNSQSDRISIATNFVGFKP